jgi:hypothetical protein
MGTGAFFPFAIDVTGNAVESAGPRRTAAGAELGLAGRAGQV